jgi:hypothetical protein
MISIKPKVNLNHSGTLEVFKDIPGYEEEYMCSNKGRVFIKKRGEYKTASQSRYNKIWNYKLSKDGKVRTFSCARIVAITWVENPNPKLFTVVITKDGNPNNYNADNVVWATRSHSQMKKFERDPELRQKFKDRFAAMAPNVSPSKKMNDELIKKLLELRKIGYSISQLEDIFPIRREQIRNIIKANGLT